MEAGRLICDLGLSHNLPPAVSLVPFLELSEHLGSRESVLVSDLGNQVERMILGGRTLMIVSEFDKFEYDQQVILRIAHHGLSWPRYHT
ncbi:hypothetical protein C496_01356 [Natronorubrum tibetense GA33]|uniref:Uncharacterized protein n=1 Tax=Natronorubrum tibetense GA33 TaxID=1114856 RepID=L9W9X5_9EURY|nr:hypothetical protein C496_01356 [Natronorubrum tibetense GA33]